MYNAINNSVSHEDVHGLLSEIRCIYGTIVCTCNEKHHSIKFNNILYLRICEMCEV